MTPDDLLDRVYDDNGRARYYRLIGQTPVACSMREWAEFFEDAEQRRVRLTRIGPYDVSTVFLGLDHRFLGDGPPILFETMTFADTREADNPEDGRDSTWSEAEARHSGAVAWLIENCCHAGERAEEIAG